MPCYGPLDAWYSKDVNPSGKRSLVFKPDYALDKDSPLKIACGRCIHCRLERSRQWAVRCVHEASLYPKNCFLTLTYNQEHLPKHGSLDHRDIQLFFKRLRKKHGKGIRYFMCGEYGPKLQRPHYHICLFNFEFEDKTPWKLTNNGDTLYVSQDLEKLWTDGMGNSLGFTTIGNLTFESAAYVARYITKKQLGQKLSTHYDIVAYDGEIIGERKPEYCVPSRRPGIASPWLEKYHKDVYPKDHCVFKGKKCKPPKYYDKWYDKYFNDDFATIKMLRLQKAKLYENLPSNELLNQKQIKERTAKKLIRSYENEPVQNEIIQSNKTTLCSI